MDEVGGNSEDPWLPADYVSLAQLHERWIKKQEEKKLKESRKAERKELKLKAESEKNNDQRGLPPDYVSLAQLQERWIKKQEEKKLKESREAERKELKLKAESEKNDQRGLERDACEKMAGLSLNDGGKGKEMGSVGSENGEKKKKRTRNRYRKKKKTMKNNRENEEEKSAADGENRNGREGAEIVEEIEVKVGNQGILSGNNGGVKGIEQIATVNMVEVLPVVEAMDSRGGFVRNRGNRRSRLDDSRKEYRVRVHDLEKKVENERGYGKKWKERRRNGDGCYKLKENDRDDVLKSNELDPEVENKVEDGISEVCNEMNGNKTEEECLNDDSVELGKKVDNGVLAIDSVRKTGNVYRRYGNGRGRNGSNFTEVCSEMNKSKIEEGCLNDDSVELGKKVDNGVVAVESVGNTGKVYRRYGNGRGRNGSNFPEVRSEMNRSNTEEECLNDDSVELEKKVDNDVLANESVRNTGKVYRRHGNERGRNGSNFTEVRSEMNQSKTEEGCLNDDSVELEKKVDNGVLAVESVRNTGNVYRRYGNGRGRNGGNFSRLGSNGWESGKVRSNVGDMRRRESGMMWVKRE